MRACRSMAASRAISIKYDIEPGSEPATPSLRPIGGARRWDQRDWRDPDVRRGCERPSPTSPWSPSRGHLLIAGPALLDPNFWRTVVLVIEHTEEGALGLVLNRPSETTVGEAVPQLEGLVDLDDQLLIGGPVQPSAVIVLAEFEDATDAALMAFDDVGVLGTGSSAEELARRSAQWPRIRRPRRLGAAAARCRARARRLDPRAGPPRGCLRRGTGDLVVSGAHAQGRKLRLDRADARRSVGQLKTPLGTRRTSADSPRSRTRSRQGGRPRRAQGCADPDRGLHGRGGHGRSAGFLAGAALRCGTHAHRCRRARALAGRRPAGGQPGARSR